jgi:hypothetical protein
MYYYEVILLFTKNHREFRIAERKRQINKIIRILHNQSDITADYSVLNYYARNPAQFIAAVLPIPILERVCYDYYKDKVLSD